MSATGAIPTALDEGRLVAAGTAFVRWARRRFVRAELNPYQERRADLEERIFLERQLRAHQLEADRARAQQRLYRGL
jgi:hypothetical protein